MDNNIEKEKLTKTLNDLIVESNGLWREHEALGGKGTLWETNGNHTTVVSIKNRLSADPSPYISIGTAVPESAELANDRKAKMEAVMLDAEKRRNDFIQKEKEFNARMKQMSEERGIPLPHTYKTDEEVEAWYDAINNKNKASTSVALAEKMQARKDEKEIADLKNDIVLLRDEIAKLKKANSLLAMEKGQRFTSDKGNNPPPPPKQSRMAFPMSNENSQPLKQNEFSEFLK